MKKILFIILFVFPHIIYADSILFDKTFGGSENDFAYSVCQTDDKGYIIAGQLGSLNGYTNNSDLYIIKLDSAGNTEWEKIYGGSENEAGFSVQCTKDDGYIVAGSTSSYGKGYPSIWILKLNNNGDSLWTRIYEGTIVSLAYSIQQTSEGGYIVAGKGKENILKLDSNGYKEWGKHYSWIFYSIEQTTDGGYIAAGDSIYQQLEWDYMPSTSIIKIDRNGDMEWSNPTGKNIPGKINSVRQTNDGGYIFTGDSIVLKSEFEHSHYLKVCKLNKNGINEWNFSGDENSSGQFIEQTNDGGYIIAGNTLDNEYGLNLLLIKLDKYGSSEWIKSYGSNGSWEYASAVHQPSDGGYIVAGQTESFGAGKYDLWILKLDEKGDLQEPVGAFDVNNPNNTFLLSDNYPNPFCDITSIPYSLIKPSYVRLEIMDTSGKEIITLVDEFQVCGFYTVNFEAFGLPSGFYYYQLIVNNKFSKTKKILIIK